eukprot:TRINITY_DN2996_c0_g1_i5.p1 TRINITY_DN2996_c0_g1~~TRINITY_DN2996_c0_g1_i5.p1  ORF type:complete len:303 (-),score=23.71 TRINITY_DN2996_c0_g1_i5:195-1103(-)
MGASCDHVFTLSEMTNEEKMSAVHYLIMFIAYVVGLEGMVRAPAFAGVVLLLGIGVFPASYFLQTPVYEWEPLSSDWNTLFLKIILISGGAFPIFMFASRDWCSSKNAGRYLAALLATNILWTLIHDVTFSVCGTLRSVCAVVQVITLCNRCYQVESAGLDLAFKDPTDTTKLVLFRPLSLLWIVGYTIWNVLFCIENYNLQFASPNAAACLGAAYLSWRSTDDKKTPYEQCWLYARGGTLSIFMTVAFWLGLFPLTQGRLETQLDCNVDLAAFTVVGIFTLVVDLVISCRSSSAHEALILK